MNDISKRFQRVFSRKDLTFGCDVWLFHRDSRSNFRDTINKIDTVTLSRYKQDNLSPLCIGAHFVTRGFVQTDSNKIEGKENTGNVFQLMEVIGHPVTLEDVLAKLGEKERLYVHGFSKKNLYFDIDTVLMDWKYYQPQSEELMQQLLNLALKYEN